jgi:hypothetical protein
MKKTNINISIILALILILVSSCENVEEGYRINYDETPAQFSVTLLSPNRGAISDSISFSIKASSRYDIKSLVVTSTVSGTNGTGYYTGKDMADPFVDHAYGTVQPGTREIDVIYYYVVSQDTVDANITFTLVDGYGKKAFEQELITVPPIVRYDSVVMYSQTSAKTDGFSTIDGMVYHNLSDYEDVTVVNESIQESLDIIFLSDELSSGLIAPYSGYFSSGMSVRNKTLFKSISGLTNEEFDNLTTASLSEITETNEVKKGTTDIQNIEVGDIIGFRTDYNSANPYHYGLLRINAIHPTIVDYYEGTSYLIEMDVVTQK